MKSKIDLRKLSSEEFVEVFNYIKRKTENFTRFYPELILENNQYLLIIRICLCLSQKDFALAVGTTKDWCRHIESGKNKIRHKRVAERYSNKIENLLKNKNVNMKTSLKKWKEYEFARDQKIFKIKKELKPISKMSERDFQKYFVLLKKRTSNFTVFDSELLLEIPQSILIFRIIAGIDHRKFAKILNINDRSLRKYEHLEMRPKKQTAEFLIKSIEKIYQEKKLTGNTTFRRALENLRILRNFFGHRNLKSMMEHGIKRIAKMTPRTSLEYKIYKLLKKNKISVKRYGVVKGFKKSFNIDFIIPNVTQPKVAIECFSCNLDRKTKNMKQRIWIIDHRFQALKMKTPKLKTIMVINFVGRPVLLNFIKKSIGFELLNTDYCLINKEVEKLPKIIKEIFITN